MLHFGMVSTWLFGMGMGLAVVFASLLFKMEMEDILAVAPAKKAAFTPPGLPFFMSERFMCATALSLSLLVVSLAP